MIDYEKVDKLVENCKTNYPDIPDYCLWVLACDYYINDSAHPTQDINVDTSNYNSRNPILLATKSNLTITNNSELFYSINEPDNFLSKGYIEIEIESPVVTANIDYITGAPIKPFFKLL